MRYRVTLSYFCNFKSKIVSKWKLTKLKINPPWASIMCQSLSRIPFLHMKKLRFRRMHCTSQWNNNNKLVLTEHVINARNHLMLSFVIYLFLITTLCADIIVHILEMWSRGLKSDVPKVIQRLEIEFRFKTRLGSCCHDALNSPGTTLSKLHSGPSCTPLSPTSLETGSPWR